MSTLTADICDKYLDEVAVAEPIFTDYGGRTVFSGPIVTVKTVDDYSRVRQLVHEAGTGKVLVVDGAGSLRHALMGGNLAKAAADNGWQGLVINGCVRDIHEIAEVDLGIKALAATPRRPLGNDRGDVDLPVTFAGVTFCPGHWLYADRDGIVVSENQVEL